MGVAAPPDFAAGDDDRRLEMLQRLLAIDATSVKGALQGACDQLVEVLDTDKADAFLYEAATDTLVAIGASDTPMGRKQRAIGMDRLPLTNGGRMVGVYRTGRPYLSEDAQQDPGVLIGFREGLGIRSLLAVPLDVDEERRGVLQIAAAQPGRYGARELRFLATVALWVGLAVQRAELVERIAREAAVAARRLAAEELITVLAHDLRNHVTPLRGQLELIRRRAERDGRARDLHSATTASTTVARIERLVADLLDSGRLERGIFALELREVDLAALAEEAAAGLARGTTPIRVQAPPELLAHADPDRLRQALENLLANAVRHAPDGTAIELTIASVPRAGARWATLTVADHGPGVPPDLLPRLFSRFAPGPGSTGLGLGLYLASRIAAAHGGTLTVDSVPGDGARFQIAVPLDGPPDDATGLPD